MRAFNRGGSKDIVAVLSEQGTTRQYHESSGIRVVESEFAPHLRIDEHTHAHGYACVTLAGSVVDRCAERTTEAAPGYSCYVPARTPHANVFGAAGARCLLLEISTETISALESAGCDPMRPWHAAGGPPAWAGLALYRHLRAGTSTSLDVEEFLARAFALRLPARLKKGAPPAWLHRVLAMLDAGIKRPPSLAALAREADIHPMHLLRVFRVQRACTPGEYIQTQRVVQACRLLLEDDIPLAQVACRLGYHDQSHFTRAFKARIGVTPGTYKTALSDSRGRLLEAGR